MRGIYIGVDATNPTLILRIRSFLRLGVEVTAFTFRRQKFNRDYQPEWKNVHLGNTVDRKYLKRIPSLIGAGFKLFGHRKTIGQAEFVYCRNFDLLILGLWVKILSLGRIALVYEIEDVQEIFFKQTFGGKLFRFIERQVLRWVDLVVCLSPGFITGYLKPVQNYSGPTYVLENKLQLQGRSPEATEEGAVWQGIQDKWVIGWFGTLRCPKSMKLLESIAQKMGDKVEIYTRGYPTETGLEAYMEIVNRNPNWTYDGEYTIPTDLEKMYGFLDEHGNSPLLLACRMYQGGFYGAVPLVVEGWQMDKWLSQRGLGYTLSPPFDDAVVDLLSSLNWEEYLDARDGMMADREANFLEDGDDTRKLLDLIQEIAAE